MRTFSACLVIVLAGLLGGGSLVVFAVFLYAGPFGLISLGLSHGGALLLDVGLSLLFFIQHSGMVRKSFRRRLSLLVPEELDAAVYATASGIALAVLLIFWQKGSPIFIAPNGIARWSFRALFWLSVLGFMWGGLSLKSFDPMGLRPVLDRLRGRPPGRMPLTAKGAYRMVRHPLYLFSILMIWSSPDLTTDRLMFNILWTVWIVIGAHLEERDLVAEFGDTYRNYQREVPMLMPGRIRKS